MAVDFYICICQCHMSQGEWMIVPGNGRFRFTEYPRIYRDGLRKTSILELQSLELNQTVPKYETGWPATKQ